MSGPSEGASPGPASAEPASTGQTASSSGPSVGRVLAQASLILTVAALASRLLGWVRLLVIGSQFGASRELDAYFAAFRIPDAIFQLVVAGALSAALIPVFSSYRARDQEVEAWRLASSVINLVIIALAGLALLMAILAPLLVPFVAPGFDEPTTELTIRMTRVMLLSPVLIGIGAVVSGILNSYERFAVPAMAPLAYNLCIIGAAIFLAPLMGVEGLAVGVAVGSLAHLAVQLPQLARVGQRYDLTIGLSHPGVRRVAWLMGPRMLGLAAGQLNFIVATVLASSLPEGSVTSFYYAFQLSQLPVGVLGVSVAVALFPTLSRDAALGRVPEIRRQVAASLRVLIFLAAPLTRRADRAGRPDHVGLLPVRPLQRTVRRTHRRRADLLRHRPGRAYRGARADARLLCDAGHTDAGHLGRDRRRHQRAADGLAGGTDGRAGPGAGPLDQRPAGGRWPGLVAAPSDRFDRGCRGAALGGALRGGGLRRGAA